MTPTEKSLIRLVVVLVVSLVLSAVWAVRYVAHHERAEQRLAMMETRLNLALEAIDCAESGGHPFGYLSTRPLLLSGRARVICYPDD